MKNYIWVCMVLTLVASAFFAQNAMAEPNADEVVGFVEKILNVIADFFDRIFQSFFDALGGLFSGDEEPKK